MRAPLALILVAVAALAASAEGARSEPPRGFASREAGEGKSWSYELERDLMSPYCPGRSLIECPSPQATELRLWIQAQEQAGVPRASVEERLLQQFGDELRQFPRAEGWGLLAYLVPGGALLAGGVFVVGFLRRQGRSPAPAPVVGAADPELAREVDRELAES